MITEIQEFKYKTEPMAHQNRIFLETRDKEYYALFWEMGTGKTKVILDNAAYLYQKGEIDGLLVISDKGAYRNWVDFEVPRHLPDNIRYRTGVWQSTAGVRATKRINQLLVAHDNCLDIVVMNVEAFAAQKAQLYAYAFLDNHYCMMVIDESDSIKTHTAKRTKNILEISKNVPYKRILTGTPIANSPLDIYTQAEFLKRGLLGESYVIFRYEYAVLMLIDYGRGKRFWQVINYQNLDKLRDRIKEWSSRILKRECLDLPPKVYEVRYVEHTPEQARMYKELKEKALTQYANSELSVTSAMTALTKLHQINCGHVKINPIDDDEDGMTIDIPSNRIDELIETLKLTPGKVIIWAHFRRDFELISKALKENHGDQSFVTYYGNTSQADRITAIERFNTDKTCRFFVSNASTGGRGITLIEADYAIYYSYSWQLALRLQSEDRNHRKGQTKTCVYIDLCTPSTIDVKIRKALQMKKDMATSVLDTFTNILMDDDV